SQSSLNTLKTRKIYSPVNTDVFVCWDYVLLVRLEIHFFLSEQFLASYFYINKDVLDLQSLFLNEHMLNTLALFILAIVQLYFYFTTYIIVYNKFQFIFLIVHLLFLQFLHTFLHTQQYTYPLVHPVDPIHLQGILAIHQHNIPYLHNKAVPL